MSECPICKFRNPRATVTAVILKNKKVLAALRTEEPFKGSWDLIGGYMNEAETPKGAMKREIKEELGVDCEMKFLDFFPGTASWQNQEFPILSIAYLVKLNGSNFKLDPEIGKLKWFGRGDLPPIAFDSNQKIIDYVKNRGLI